MKGERRSVYIKPYKSYSACGPVIYYIDIYWTSRTSASAALCDYSPAFSIVFLLWYGDNGGRRVPAARFRSLLFYSFICFTFSSFRISLLGQTWKYLTAHRTSDCAAKPDVCACEWGWLDSAHCIPLIVLDLRAPLFAFHLMSIVHLLKVMQMIANIQKLSINPQLTCCKYKEAVLELLLIRMIPCMSSVRLQSELDMQICPCGNWFADAFYVHFHRPCRKRLKNVCCRASWCIAELSWWPKCLESSREDA